MSPPPPPTSLIQMGFRRPKGNVSEKQQSHTNTTHCKEMSNYDI